MATVMETLTLTYVPAQKTGTSSTQSYSSVCYTSGMAVGAITTITRLWNSVKTPVLPLKKVTIKRGLCLSRLNTCCTKKAIRYECFYFAN